MIIRRFVKAIRHQDWSLAALDFLIVVLGIFFGLQVDNWQTDLENQRLEADYISRLAVDLQQDIEKFDLEIAQLQRKAAFIQSLMDASITPLFAKAPRQVMADKVVSSFRGAPAIKGTTFNELISTGRLALISDTTLRSTLAEYYEDYASFERQVDVFDISDYPALINGYVPGSIAKAWRLNDTISDPEGFIRSLEALSKDPDLLAAGNSEIAYAAAIQFYLENYTRRAKELLDRLLRASAI